MCSPRTLPSVSLKVWLELYGSLTFCHQWVSIVFNFIFQLIHFYGCCGLNGGPQKRCPCPILLKPMNVTLFGKRVFADVIKLGWQDETILDYPGEP